MRLKSPNLILGLALGGVLAAPTMASADAVHARVRVGPAGHVHVGVVDRFHRVPPDIRARGWRGGHFAVRANPFRAHLGWRIARFTPHERLLWTHGRWWHGRWNGRFGWWWGVNGGWFFYTAPVYPYPDYVSDTIYNEPGQDYSDYWYYCRNPAGYYPYVSRCYGQWEPVPPQPQAGYNGGAGPGPDQYGPGPGGGPDQYGPGPGPDQDQMGPDDGGPPDEGPPDQGPPDNSGPPDQGPPGGYGNDQGPPDDQGPPPDDQGPPDQGPPPR